MLCYRTVRHRLAIGRQRTTPETEVIGWRHVAAARTAVLVTVRLSARLAAADPVNIDEGGTPLLRDVVAIGVIIVVVVIIIIVIIASSSSSSMAAASPLRAHQYDGSYLQRPAGLESNGRVYRASCRMPMALATLTAAFNSDSRRKP